MLIADVVTKEKQVRSTQGIVPFPFYPRVRNFEAAATWYVVAAH